MRGPRGKQPFSFFGSSNSVLCNYGPRSNQPLSCVGGSSKNPQAASSHRSASSSASCHNVTTEMQDRVMDRKSCVAVTLSCPSLLLPLWLALTGTLKALV
jgi:hypothetical protein